MPAPSISPGPAGAVRLLGAAIAAAGFLAGGCSERDQSRPEEKVLHIYNWADYIGKNTIARFERETGIDVVYDTYDSDATLEAKMMAGDSGYDIVTTSTNFFSRQIKAGVYAPLDRSFRTGRTSTRTSLRSRPNRTLATRTPSPTCTRSTASPTTSI